MNSYKYSKIVCEAVGINLALKHAKLYKVTAVKQLKKAKIVELVIEKSKNNNWIEIILLIENCSSGE